VNFIEIECFYHSESSSQLKDLGIEYSFEDCETRPILFFNINAISYYVDKGKNYGCVHCNGSEFITVLGFEELKNKINGFIN
jgi:hypothetical protein